jgi:hypothetical protein
MCQPKGGTCCIQLTWPTASSQVKSKAVLGGDRCGVKSSQVNGGLVAHIAMIHMVEHLRCCERAEIWICCTAPSRLATVSSMLSAIVPICSPATSSGRRVVACGADDEGSRCGEGARVRGREGARVRGCEGARARGCEGAKVRGCEGARARRCAGARVRGCGLVRTLVADEGPEVLKDLGDRVHISRELGDRHFTLAQDGLVRTELRAAQHRGD